MSNFEERLKGGHPNSLGNTVEIVEEILNDPSLFDELFHCYFSTDEVVRLRVSNGMKRICKANKKLLIPFIDRFLNEISKIDQASTQWTLSQLFLQLKNDMSANQIKNATEIMKNNLIHHQDWIVLSQTMETLAIWAKNDEDLKKWLPPHLIRLSNDKRKSVAKKAGKVKASL
ncbi:hypothetical protein [Croceitalea rosinachiae]|uniref:DNA alkylation repair enzyme n=1 Tax=Croceitalea rosinachiae TaxID=3075596 RepID=A0ABU3AA18_9FLAO|nr:hypothetical protein [Croceitalea sp. F388]MDT0607026.1 hypothetical protein [Croceitalea sp. F388]